MTFEVYHCISCDCECKYTTISQNWHRKFGGFAQNRHLKYVKIAQNRHRKSVKRIFLLIVADFCKFASVFHSNKKFIVMERKEIPVLLLTGYLGSGKTTLVNRILNNRRGIRFAVIVNDIGEVNIDADSFSASIMTMYEMHLCIPI